MHLQVFELPLPEQKLERKISTAPLDDEKDDQVGSAQHTSNSVEPLFDGTMKRVRTKLEKHPVPQLRIVAYDPRSRQKSVLLVDKGAVCEVAGGVYSMYLEPVRRRELSRLVCESLQLHFPKGKPFELIVPWSGAEKKATGAQAGDKNTWRSSADRIHKRNGKIFRAGVRISNLELIVTVFMHVPTKEEEKALQNTLLEQDLEALKNQIVVNFYSSAACEAFEIVVDDKDQRERVGKAILEYPVGPVRATAIRNLCRFFRADLIDDPEDLDTKILRVELIPAKKDFLEDYRNVGAPRPGEDVRPVGAPTVFLPLDTCGEMLSRKGVLVPTAGRHGVETSPGKEYVVSVFSKSVTDGPEKGLVVKMYNRTSAKTLVIHIGPSELIRLCDRAGQPELLRDMVAARWLLKDEQPDILEADFITVTERGTLIQRAKVLVDQVVNIVVGDIGIRVDALGEEFPCLRSSPTNPT